MAMFKVGQRVRIIKAGDPPHVKRAGYCGTILGATGFKWRLDVIVGTLVYGRLYDVRVDELDGIYMIPGSHLAPLTDPKAEAFLESIRQLKPLPVQEIA